MKKQNNKNIIHCCLVGDCRVGKTTLIQSFLNEDVSTYNPTIFDNYAGNVTCFGDTYTVSLFDNSGLQEYAGLREFGYSESHVIAICFSLTDRASFNNVKEFWAPEVRRYLGSKKSIVLVGLHGDNTENKPNYEQVSIEECQTLAKEIRAKKYLECTPRDSTQATELFKDISKISIKQNKRFRFGKLWCK